MGNFTLGFKALLRVWDDEVFAGQVRQLLEPSAAAPAVHVPESPAPPRRSEAVSLLAVLQREARLVDFLQEPIGDYSDAQIGAAVRSVHQDSAAVLERLFALAPLRAENEGAPIEVPPGFDSAKFRLLGNVAGNGPFRGSLSHPGWQATQCEIPAWTGRNESALVIAPAEVELK